MKKLFIVRHAHASWPQEVKTDKERPLSEKGKQEAKDMAKRMKKEAVSIDLMLVSSARRTQETADIMKKSILIKETRTVDALYESDYETIIELIDTLDSSIERVMIVAHNPAVSMLASYFLGIYADLPPATVVSMAFECQKWSQIARESLRFDKIETP